MTFRQDLIASLLDLGVELRGVKTGREPDYKAARNVTIKYLFNGKLYEGVWVFSKEAMQSCTASDIARIIYSNMRRS